jgi:hypothetical protein
MSVEMYARLITFVTSMKCCMLDSPARGAETMPQRCHCHFFFGAQPP